MAGSFHPREQAALMTTVEALMSRALRSGESGLVDPVSRPEIILGKFPGHAAATVCLYSLRLEKENLYRKQGTATSVSA
jgi:hypothetical protein